MNRIPPSQEVPQSAVGSPEMSRADAPKPNIREKLTRWGGAAALAVSGLWLYIAAGNAHRAYEITNEATKDRAVAVALQNVQAPEAEQWTEAATQSEQIAATGWDEVKTDLVGAGLLGLVGLYVLSDSRHTV